MTRPKALTHGLRRGKRVKKSTHGVDQVVCLQRANGAALGRFTVFVYAFTNPKRAFLDRA